MNELKRILTDKKRLVALIAIPILCLAFFMLERMHGDIRNGIRWLNNELEAYRENYAKFSAMTLNEAAQDTSEYYGLDSGPNLRSTAMHVRDYGSYLDNVKKQAEKMSNSSIFGKDKSSFTYKNIQKTAKDFEKLRGIEAEFGNNRAVEKWLSYKTADALYLLVIVLFVLAFFEDRKNGLAPLIRATPNGRGRLAVSRLFILLGAAVVFTILLYATTLTVSFALYGGQDGLGRSIQSLEGFKTCTFRVTILEWIILYFGAKVVCGFFLGLIFWFILSFLSHMQLAVFVIIGILALEYAAYTLIPPQMALSVLRYVNVFSYVYPSELLSKYVNMNFFGLPVSAPTLLIWLMVILGIALLIAVVCIQIKRYPYGNKNLLGRFILVWNRFCDFFRRHFTLPVMEGYKLLILGGTVIFLAACAYFGPKLYFRGYEYNQQVSYVYKQYVSEVKGPINDKTYEYLANAREQLELHPGVDGEFEASVDRIEADITSAAEKAKEGGYEAWMLDQTEFSNIFGEKVRSVHQWNALIAMAFIILCIAPVFAFERQAGTERILRATPRGRASVFFSKYAVLFVETLAIWALIYLRQWIKTADLLGHDLLAAPIRNIEVLSGFPINITFGGYLAVFFVLRFIGMLIVSHVMACLSSLVNGWEKAVMLGVGFLMIPAVLYYFGQNWAGYISVMPVISASEYLAPTEGVNIYAILALCWLLLAVFLTLLAYRSWTSAKATSRKA